MARTSLGDAAKKMGAIDGPGIFRAIKSGLAARTKGDDFLTFLKRMQHSTADANPLELGSDTEAMRFLYRLGAVSSPKTATERAKAEVNLFLEHAARVGAPNPAIGSVLLRAFASGLYGLIEPGICGEVPQCDTCPLAAYCKKKNAPEENAYTYTKGDFPSERIDNAGAASLSTEELMAVLLGRKTFALEEKSVAECGRILEATKGLRGLATNSVKELMADKSLDKKSARVFVAAMELARRWSAEFRYVGKKFAGAADFFSYYKTQLRDKKKEVFIVALLDQKNRLLRDEVVSEGTLNFTVTEPREVFALAIKESAASVAFIHNHPSGDPSPSNKDILTTETLMQMTSFFEIRLLDHVIIADNRYYSFRENGYIKES